MTLTRAAPFIFLLLWSGGFTVAKVGIHDADPLTLLALRYVCVVALILPLYFIYKPALPKNRHEYAHIICVGFLIQVVYFGAAYKAFEAGASAGAVALITSLQPIFVAMVIPMLSDETVTRRTWLGLALGLAGSAIVIIANTGVQVTGTLALLFSFAALVAITLGTVWEKRFGVSHHPITTNLVQYIVGALCLLPLAWLTEPMNINWTLPFGFALFYLVVCNSILAISLLIMMIRKGEATKVSALFFLVPPMSALLAWFFIGELMATEAWLGMLVAAIGVWMVTSGKKTTPKTVTSDT